MGVGTFSLCEFPAWLQTSLATVANEEASALLHMMDDSKCPDRCRHIQKNECEKM
jgi:hypothetical protein